VKENSRRHVEKEVSIVLLESNNNTLVL